MESTIYQECQKRGIPCRNHESDLYIPMTDETTQLLVDYDDKITATIFTNQIEGGWWYDVPFAFDPFWEQKGRCRV